MGDPIQPALTPTEWARALSLPPGVVWGFHEDEGSINAHQLAAIALHGQPFGFTHEDVRRLREAADRYGGSILDMSDWWEFLDSLADRISALLPPETPNE